MASTGSLSTTCGVHVDALSLTYLLAVAAFSSARLNSRHFFFVLPRLRKNHTLGSEAKTMAKTISTSLPKSISSLPIFTASVVTANIE